MADPVIEIRWGGGNSHPDPEIRGAQCKRNFFFRPFGSQFGPKIRGGLGGGGLARSLPWYFVKELPKRFHLKGIKNHRILSTKLILKLVKSDK